MEKDLREIFKKYKIELAGSRFMVSSFTPFNMISLENPNENKRYLIGSDIDSSYFYKGINA